MPTIIMQHVSQVVKAWDIITFKAEQEQQQHAGCMHAHVRVQQPLCYSYIQCSAIAIELWLKKRAEKKLGKKVATAHWGNNSAILCLLSSSGGSKIANKHVYVHTRAYINSSFITT